LVEDVQNQQFLWRGMFSQGVEYRKILLEIKKKHFKNLNIKNILIFSQLY